jgi:replicative DNA helicase
MNARNHDLDQLPPCAIESEMCVLGAMILAGNDPAVMAAIRATLTVGDFYQADHQILYRVIGDVYDRCRTIDAMLLREELGRRQITEDVGGLPYLADILRAAPNARSGAHYASDVREKSVLRRLITGAHEVLRRANGPSTAPAPTSSPATSSPNSTASPRAGAPTRSSSWTRSSTTSSATAPTASPPRSAPAWRNSTPSAADCPSRGSRSLPDVLGMGKSQLGKQIVRNAATGLPAERTPFGDVSRPAQAPMVCGIVTVEELNKKIGGNYLSAVSGVENNRIANGTCNANEWRLIEDAAPDLARLPIYLSDRPIRLDDVESVITTMVTRFRCELVFVDYLQLIHGPNEGTKEQEIARISTTLKNIGKTLGVTMVVAAQLSRANETGGVRRPEMRDLRHSGQIEQDGDLIVLLHRDDYYHYKDRDFSPTNILEAIVAKNKNGPLGTALLNFEGKYQTVTDRKAGQTYPPADEHVSGKTRTKQSIPDRVDPAR